MNFKSSGKLGTKSKRFTISIFLILAMLMATTFPVLAFSENESRSVENFFVEAKLLKGDGTSYGLENTATRMEGIIILIRLMGKEQKAMEMQNLPCVFEDVPVWARGYANYAYSENISKGVSEKRFGVNEPMTANQYNTLMLRVLGYSDSLGDFRWDDAVNSAESFGVLPMDMVLNYVSYEYTKGDLMETSFCYLEANFKSQNQSLIEKLIEEGTISDDLAASYGLDVDGWSSITTNLNKEEYFTFKISDEQLYLEGVSKDTEKNWIAIQVEDVLTGAKKTDTTGFSNSDGKYNINLSLTTLGDGEYYVDLYGNSQKYGSYTSFLLSSVIIKKIDGKSLFKAPVVYGQNLRIHNGNEIGELDYSMTPQTRANPENVEKIKNLANTITLGVEGDYNKVKAISQWVSNEIYYDKDFLKGKTDRTNISSISVLENKYAVCSGYANLVNDLVAALGIPNRQTIGYVFGITEEDTWEEVDYKNLEANHVWNEVFIDGRWAVIDATWDSSNYYEGGIFTKGKTENVYFDTTMEFFSGTHKLIMP